MEGRDQGNRPCPSPATPGWGHLLPQPDQDLTLKQNDSPASRNQEAEAGSIRPYFSSTR